MGRAGWVVGLIVFPLIGSLVYLIVRGQGMAHRSAARERAARSELNTYIRDVAASPGAGSVDDLSRLADLRANGTITDVEFETIKARITGGTTATR